jgi:hypothetical protein
MGVNNPAAAIWRTAFRLSDPNESLSTGKGEANEFSMPRAWESRMANPLFFAEANIVYSDDKGSEYKSSGLRHEVA